MVFLTDSDSFASHLRQEVEMELDEEARLSVKLIYPIDNDLISDILNHRLTIAQAIKRVATRRQLEREMAEIERHQDQSS